MIFIKQINEKDIDLCYELDLGTISLWSKNQWANELKKENVKVIGVLIENLVVGICVFQVILDEAQINYFVVKQRFRKKGFGSYLMSYLIKECEKLRVDKLFLEVSKTNIIADKFYSSFNFLTVGTRRSYYKDGSDALLKEKKINNKIIKKFNCSDNQNA